MSTATDIVTPSQVDAPAPDNSARIAELLIELRLTDVLATKKRIRAKLRRAGHYISRQTVAPTTVTHDHDETTADSSQY